MRKLTSGERKLSIVFGSMIFVLLNVLVLKHLMASSQRIHQRILTLDASLQENRELLKDRPYWESRQKWLAATPMGNYLAGESDSKFAESLQKSLTDAGLAIESQQLHEAKLANGVFSVSLDVVAKGRLEQIVRWLQQVQQPGKFLVVRAFSLKRFDEGSGMVARMTVCQLFSQAPLLSR